MADLLLTRRLTRNMDALNDRQQAAHDEIHAAAAAVEAAEVTAASLEEAYHHAREQLQEGRAAVIAAREACETTKTERTNEINAIKSDRHVLLTLFNLDPDDQEEKRMEEFLESLEAQVPAAAPSPQPEAQSEHQADPVHSSGRPKRRASVRAFTAAKSEDELDSDYEPEPVLPKSGRAKPRTSAARGFTSRHNPDPTLDEVVSERDQLLAEVQRLQGHVSVPIPIVDPRASHPPGLAYTFDGPEQYGYLETCHPIIWNHKTEQFVELRCSVKDCGANADKFHFRGANGFMKHLLRTHQRTGTTLEQAVEVCTYRAVHQQEIDEINGGGNEDGEYVPTLRSINVLGKFPGVKSIKRGGPNARKAGKRGALKRKAPKVSDNNEFQKTEDAEDVKVAEMSEEPLAKKRKSLVEYSDSEDEDDQEDTTLNDSESLFVH